MRFFIALLLLLALPLSGCYRPLYGNKDSLSSQSAGEHTLGAIALGNIPDEHGQVLRNLLIDRMYAAGRPAAATRRLDVQLSSLEERLGLQKDATTTRARLTLKVGYTLVNTATGEKLFSTTSRSVVSYNELDDHYATLSSKEDAYRRGLVELADIMVARLLLFTSQGE